MRKGTWLIIGIGIAISLVAAGILSFYASSSPDGLEKVAEQHGFLEQAQDSANATLPTADYTIAGVENERLSVGLSGVLGVAVMILVGFGLFWIIGRGRKPAGAAASEATGSEVDPKQVTS